jgi:hypothetical protein
MTSPIFDAIVARRDATPIFESVAVTRPVELSVGEPRRAARPSRAPRSARTAAPTPHPAPAASPTALLEPSTATWPLRRVC